MYGSKLIRKHMFFNQTFEEFMGRFVWNKWKQSCHQTFESPEEAVLFAVSCWKRLLNMSLSARALSMAVLPDTSPRVQCDDRWTQQANTSRKHDTRSPVLFLRYGHKKLPTLAPTFKIPMHQGCRKPQSQRSGQRRLWSWCTPELKKH